MPVPADPTVLHPMPGQPRVVLLKPLVKSPLIEVGEFSYYDDPDDPTAFETRNVLYHYGPEKLVIGKFCALGTGVRFIMNGANHRMDGPSTFPFPTMGGSWSDHFDLLTGLPNRGDTVVGNDVWFGYSTTVMPVGTDRARRDRRLGGRRHDGRARLRDRRRQPGPSHPHPLRRRGHRAASGGGVVGLVRGARHRACTDDHVRQHRRSGSRRRGSPGSYDVVNVVSVVIAVPTGQLAD